MTIRMGGPKVLADDAGVEVYAEAADGSKACTFVVSKEALEDLERAEDLRPAELLSAYHAHSPRLAES